MVEPIVTKQCTECKRVLLVSQFSPDKKYRDGLRNSCRDCRSAHRRNVYQLNPQIREAAHNRMRKYLATEKGRQTRYRYQYSSEGARSRRIANKKHRQRNREQRLTDKLLHAAISRGKIPPAKECVCAHCGKQAREYHHHRGYAREYRLDVIPLCVRCHKDVHSRQKTSPHAFSS